MFLGIYLFRLTKSPLKKRNMIFFSFLVPCHFMGTYLSENLSKEKLKKKSVARG